MNNVLGNYLGEGKTRIVYDYLPDPSYVVKLNKSETVDTNRLEYQTYLYFKKYNLDYLLCPCQYKNDFFLMKKAQKPVTGRYNVPCYFSTKDYNWGMIEDRLVRIDYAWNIILTATETYIKIENRNIDNFKNIPEMLIESESDYFKIMLKETSLNFWTNFTHVYEVK